MRQIRTSAEHHLKGAIIGLGVGSGWEWVGVGGCWGWSGGNTTAEFEGLFISSRTAGA